MIVSGLAVSSRLSRFGKNPLSFRMPPSFPRVPSLPCSPGESRGGERGHGSPELLGAKGLADWVPYRLVFGVPSGLTASTPTAMDETLRLVFAAQLALMESDLPHAHFGH